MSIRLYPGLWFPTISRGCHHGLYWKASCRIFATAALLGSVRLTVANARRRRNRHNFTPSRRLDELSYCANFELVSEIVTTRRNGRRHLLGLFVCALLVFFAVEAKVSLYPLQHKDMKVLSTTKVWQNSAGRAVPAPPVFEAILAVTIAFLLLANAFTSEERVTVAEPRLTRFEWFSPDLFVRPPPTI